MVEGIEGGTGEGYSKKESQQLASKKTLNMLKKDSQYLDSVFAAKTNRTKMEEEPVMTVPETDIKTDFIVSQKEEKTAPVTIEREKKLKKATAEKTSEDKDEFDLSDITALPKAVNKEDIIAAAEAAAFS